MQTLGSCAMFTTEQIRWLLISKPNQRVIQKGRHCMWQTYLRPARSHILILLKLLLSSGKIMVQESLRSGSLQCHRFCVCWAAADATLLFSLPPRWAGVLPKALQSSETKEGTVREWILRKHFQSRTGWIQPRASFIDPQSWPSASVKSHLTPSPFFPMLSRHCQHFPSSLTSQFFIRPEFGNLIFVKL